MTGNGKRLDFKNISVFLSSKNIVGNEPQHLDPGGGLLYPVQPLAVLLHDHVPAVLDHGQREQEDALAHQTRQEVSLLLLVAVHLSLRQKND